MIQLIIFLICAHNSNVCLFIYAFGEDMPSFLSGCIGNSEKSFLDFFPLLLQIQVNLYG